MKKYFLTTRYKLLHLIFGLILSLMIATLPFQFNKILFLNLVFAILIIFSSTYWIRKENLSVSEEGLEYNGPDIAFGTKWENVESISIGWHFPFRVEGVIVDRSLIRLIKMTVGITKRYPGWGFSQTVFIPVSCFSNNWRDSELGQKIKQYAPHLFDKSIKSA
jgi:hypothetical protein